MTPLQTKAQEWYLNLTANQLIEALSTSGRSAFEDDNSDLSIDEIVEIYQKSH